MGASERIDRVKEMIEKLETLNQRLIDGYGKYSDGRATWRIIFSHDEMEKRWTRNSPEGFELLTPEVIEVPKYRQWINPPCYVLERLLEIPEGVETDQTEKTSYEPVWVFRDKNNNPLIPMWAAIKLVIETVYDNSARAMGRKYKDPREELVDPKIAVEAREANLNEIEKELFGEEKNPLQFGQGIVVPNNYEKVN